MTSTNIIPAVRIVKEFLVMGTTSALEEFVLKKRIDNLQSEDPSLVSQLQEVRRANQHFSSVLEQIQQVVDEGIEFSEIYDILSDAIEEVKRFRTCPVNYTHDLIKYSVSLMLYNR